MSEHSHTVPSYRWTWPSRSIVGTVLLGACCFAPLPAVVFAPPEGRIYSGAGQDMIASIAMVNTADPERRPAIVAFYDATLKFEEWDRDWLRKVLRLPDFFPGAYLQIGADLPDYGAEGLRAVAEGAFDDRIDAMISVYRHLPAKVFFRLGYEADGNKGKKFPDPAAYRAAYRYVVERFRAAGVDELAYVWNVQYASSDGAEWYPGDDVVDWWSYNAWKKDFDAGAFTARATARGKPVMIGECTELDHDDWGDWAPTFFDSLRTNAPQGYQYINYWWTSYGYNQSFWGDARYTDDPEHIALYNAEMARPVYVHRDPACFNPMALYIRASGRSIDQDRNGEAWTASLDAVSAQPGYGLIRVEGAVHDGIRTRPSHWQAAAGRHDFTVALGVPRDSRGYLVLTTDAIAKTIRLEGQSLAEATTATIHKYSYDETASDDGELLVRFEAAIGDAVACQHIGIQAIAADAFDAPTQLQAKSVRDDQVALSWAAMDGAYYGIYRDGEKIACSSTPAYRDQAVSAGSEHRYRVTAFHRQRGEGAMSAPSDVVVSDNAAPVIEGLAALPHPVTSTDCLLQAMASDAEDGALPVSWELRAAPTGGEAVIDQGASVTVQFSKAGSYRFVAMASDSDGATATAELTVTVVQNGASVVVDHQ